MHKRTILAAAAITFGLVAASTGGAVAGSMITGAQIKNNTVRSVDLKDGHGVGKVDLKPGLRKQVEQKGKRGPRGLTGKRGPAGPQGKPGEEFTLNKLLGNDDFWAAMSEQFLAIGNEIDILGSGRVVLNEDATIAKIGGAFSSNSTKVGDFILPEGKYLLSTDAYFDRLDNSAPSTPQMQVAVRGPGGMDYGTILTGNFPEQGDREMTGSASRIVVSNGETPITVRAFGYNNTGSSAGSGNYTASVTVSAIRVG